MSSKNFQPWLEHLINEGRQGSRMARIVLNLVERLDALEKATAETVKKSLTVAPGGPLPEMPELSDEAFRRWDLPWLTREDRARRLYRAGWDAAMAAVKAQQERDAVAESAPDPSVNLEQLVLDTVRSELSTLGVAATAANVPLVQQMAGKISAGGGATNLSIEVLLIVADWLESQGCISGVCSLRAEAHRAMEDLRRRGSRG